MYIQMITLYSERDTINSECLYKWLHCTVKEIQLTVNVYTNDYTVQWKRYNLQCMYKWSVH